MPDWYSMRFELNPTVVLLSSLVLCATNAVAQVTGSARSGVTSDESSKVTSAKSDEDPVCYLEFARDGRKYQTTAKLLVEAQDGGLLCLAEDNVLWDVQPAELQSRELRDPPLKFLTGKSLETQVLKELPAGFQTYTTRHYLICFNTARPYARWCAGLFERLYGTLHGYWKDRGVELHEPDTLLVAFVFDSPESYQEYAHRELGQAASQVIGYYSLHTNRIAMYDLTGVLASRQGRRTSSSSLINELLASPDAERTVATVIHEATHQIAFNCGLQTRFSDVPLWLSEGLAMYCESPDLQNRQGWRMVGGPNRMRWLRFQNFLPERSADSLVTLVRDDERFRKGAVEDAYAESWALCYYLIQRHPQKFVAYMKALAAQPPLAKPTPDQRLAQFQAAFGNMPDGFESAMLNYVMSGP